MDFDTEKTISKKMGFRSLIMVCLMGGIGIIIPVIALFVATFKGVSELSLFNSTLLLVLSLLVVVFIAVRSIGALFDNDKKLVLAGLIFIVADVISLIINLMSYMVL